MDKFLAALIGAALLSLAACARSEDVDATNFLDALANRSAAANVAGESENGLADERGNGTAVHGERPTSQNGQAPTR